MCDLIEVESNMRICLGLMDPEVRAALLEVEHEETYTK